MRQRLYTLLTCTLLATLTGPATGFGTMLVAGYIDASMRTHTFANPLPLYGFLFLAYMFGGPFAAFPGALAYSLALALIPSRWLAWFRARGHIFASLACGVVLGALCGLVSAWVWHSFTAGPFLPTLGFIPFVVGGAVSGLLCFLVYAPPNPSLNRTRLRRAG